MMSVLFNVGFRLLQFVNLRVNGLKFLGIVGPVVFRFGHVGNLLQRVFIDVHWPVFVDYVAGKWVPTHGHRGLAAGADTNRVNLDSPRSEERRVGKEWRS